MHSSNKILVDPEMEKQEHQKELDKQKERVQKVSNQIEDINGLKNQNQITLKSSETSNQQLQQDIDIRFSNLKLQKLIEKENPTKNTTPAMSTGTRQSMMNALNELNTPDNNMDT